MIGKHIKKIREKYNITQKELADELIVSDKTISSWENDRTLPDIYTLEKISKLYKISMNDLMEGNVSKLSILKYRVKRIGLLLKTIFLENMFISTFVLISVLSLITLLILNPLNSFYYIYTSFFLLTIILIFKFSYWFYILLIISLPELVSNVIMISNPEYFHNNFIYKYQNDYIPVINVVLIVNLSVFIIYFIHSLIKKTNSRSKNIIVFATISMYLFVYFLITKLFMLSYSGMNINDEYKSNVQKEQYYTLFLIMIIGTLILLTSINLLENKKNNNKTIL